jgi:hypothetical protein
MPAANRYSAWFDGRLADWQIDADAPAPYIDLNYFAAVFREFEQLMPDSGLHVVATTALGDGLPATGPNVVVLCMGDEFVVPPAYSHEVRLVVKTLGGARRRPYVAVTHPRRWPALPMAVAQETVVQARRLPWLARSAQRSITAHRRPAILDVPIGIRAFEQSPAVPFAERQYDVAFAGSLVNEATEHKRRWQSQKLRARQAFLDETERLQANRPDLSVWLRVVPTHWDGASATRSYAAALADSRIVLCPRGSSLDTYRYFEALRAGCVPVYEMLPSRDYYNGAPGVRVGHWSQLPTVIDRMVSNPAGLLAQHHAALDWYIRWAAPAAVAQRIADRLTRQPA